MRALFLLGLGLLSGVVMTVLLFTLNAALSHPSPPAAGVGNARIVMDPHSLGLMVASSLKPGPQGIPVLVEVEIRSEGTLIVNFGVTPGDSAPQGSLTLDPNVREGNLVITVVESDLSRGDPEAIAAAIEEELKRRLDSLAGGSDYTLVSIGTAGNGLTLEIDL